MAEDTSRPLALVTGASSGIGRELARRLAAEGYALVVAAEDEGIDIAARVLGATTDVEAVRADLSTADGVEQLVEAVGDRDVDVLAVNAGTAVGGGSFVDTDLERHLGLISLNVTGAVHLAHRLLPRMVARGAGRVLFTSSIAATTPGPYMSTYNASKSFLYSFSQALRVELRDSGVTVTALMPGPTDTELWARADMEDTAMAQAPMDDPADVADAAFEAMMSGDDRVITGLRHKAQVAAAGVVPDTALAKLSGKLAEPGSGA